MRNAYAKKQSAHPLESQASGEHTWQTARTTRARLRKSLRSDGLAGYLFIAPAIVGFSIFVVYPLIDSAYLSLTSWNGLTDPVFIGFKNFIIPFKDRAFSLPLKFLRERNNLVPETYP